MYPSSFFLSFFSALKQQELVGKMVKCVRKHKRMFCFDSEPHGWSVAMLDLDRDSFFSLQRKMYVYMVVVFVHVGKIKRRFYLWKKRNNIGALCLCVLGKKSSFGAAELLLSG